MTQKPSYEELEQKVKVLEKALRDQRAFEQDKVTGSGKPYPSNNHHIKAQRKLEKSLDENEKKFYEIFQASQDAIFIATFPEGEFVDVNKSFERIFGYRRDEIVGKTFLDSNLYKTPDDRDRFIPDYIKKKHLQDKKLELIKKSGDAVLVNANLRLVNINGVDFSIAVISDITEQVQSEIALKNTKQFLETILDHTPMMVASFDSALNYKKVNQAYAKMRGKDSLFFSGKNHFDLYPDKKNKTIFENVVETGRPYMAYSKPIEFEEYSKKTIAYCDWSLIPIKNSSDIVTGLVLTIMDVSERKILESEMIQADKMISLGTLVTGVAHEINNPNNFISMNTPILYKTWQSILPILDEYHDKNGDFRVAKIPYSDMKERVPKLLSGISDGSSRIKRIVQDLKRFSQPEFSTHNESVDINSVVRSALNLIGNMVRKHTENFLVEYGLNLPPIKGSYQRLEQVIINLIQNACYALPDKRKAVYVSTVYDQKTDCVLVKIVDEGKGIPSRHMPRLMDPFFTTRRDSGGTGLGLSVSSTIVREHSGQIFVTSEFGKGSTFTVSIPLTIEKALKKVLVVDDDDFVRELIVTLINKKFVCRVEETTNGIECCIRLGTFQPDLLIVDIHMPDMNGVDVCKKIKSDPVLSKTQVVIITGHAESDEAMEIKKMGYTKMLSKPFDSKLFYRTIEDIFT